MICKECGAECKFSAPDNKSHCQRHIYNLCDWVVGSL